MQSSAMPVETLATGLRSEITCVATADPLLYVRCSDGSIAEIKQDITTGSWVVDGGAFVDQEFIIHIAP
eukprot:m51a1_g3201 hypothetical protein (69) ;mRNA; r:1052-11110